MTLSNKPSNLRPVQLDDRPACPGPEFTIKSGAFGGEWSSDRGDLEVEFFEPTQIGS